MTNNENRDAKIDHFLPGLRIVQIVITLLLIYLLVNVHGLIVDFLTKLNTTADETHLLIKEQRFF